MRERRESSSGGADKNPGAFDPIAGGQGPTLAVALVIGRSASERESVARAMHREQRGADGPLQAFCGEHQLGLFVGRTRATADFETHSLFEVRARHRGLYARDILPSQWSFADKRSGSIG